MRPATRRQRAYRRRAARGVSVLRIEVDFCATVDALLASSRLTPAAALHRHAVEKALGEVVSEWAAKWLGVRA
jgi:hypothetical protein